jgi:hypothetical protein
MLMEIRSSMSELSHEELDLVLMGQIMAFTRLESKTTARHHPPHLRQRAYSTFYHQGKQVAHHNYETPDDLKFLSIIDLSENILVYTCLWKTPFRCCKTVILQ